MKVKRLKQREFVGNIYSVGYKLTLNNPGYVIKNIRY